MQATTKTNDDQYADYEFAVGYYNNSKGLIKYIGRRIDRTLNQTSVYHHEETDTWYAGLPSNSDIPGKTKIAKPTHIIMRKEIRI